MVSMMDGANGENRAAIAASAISQRSIDLQISPKTSIDDELARSALTLDLRHQSIVDGEDRLNSAKSPKSPLAGNRAGLPHQKSITSQVEVVEDRKALRDALYQGIFHRHRRTIFAVGSFLRMLRSRNSQYNTIRSTSEGEEDTR